MHFGCEVRFFLGALLIVSYLPSSRAADPAEEDGKEQCPGGPPGVKNGDVTSNVIEARGLDYVERCYPGPQSRHLIQDREWTCKTRYCCQDSCFCNETQVDQCSSGTSTAMRCLVEHVHATPRFYVWKCCDGYVEHPENQQCLITCEKNNGGCHQLCSPSEDPPHEAVCSCFPGHRFHDDDPNICVDHDECLTLNGGCSDICNNTLGSYECFCKPGRNFTLNSKLICEDIPVDIAPPVVLPAPPVVLPASQETNDKGSTAYVIGGIVGGILVLGLLILLLLFLCRRKKKEEERVTEFENQAYTNATYDDLEHQGARAPLPEYGDTAAVKKVPIDGAVGLDDPDYIGQKKAIEAASSGPLPNDYEEIPYDTDRRGVHNKSYEADYGDGYERPVSVIEEIRKKTPQPRENDGVRKMSLPGEVDEDEVVKGRPRYPNQAAAMGARPKRQQGGAFGYGTDGALAPPKYSEIPTPGEVEADPRPPRYTNNIQEPVRFKDFQDVNFDNMNNEILDIKDIDVRSKEKK